jgi:hypothetical protein
MALSSDESKVRSDTLTIDSRSFFFCAPKKDTMGADTALDNNVTRIPLVLVAKVSGAEERQSLADHGGLGNVNDISS